MENFSEISINYKPLKPYFELPQINCSKDAHKLFLEFWSDKIQYKEEFNILLLNIRNGVLGISKISEGGISATHVDPKIIFQTALKANATGIVLGHNHPSGQPYPSEADRKITTKLFELGKIMDLPILDHIICGDNTYYSFRDEGII